MNTTSLRIPSNRVDDIIRYTRGELRSLYADGEVEMFIRMLFEAFLGWSQAQLLVRRGETINQSDLLKFHWAVEDLKRQRPIQHITGFTDFCGCTIGVGPEVLIPRPETEEIVFRTIEHLQGHEPRTLLDLCTGSGCMAVALARTFPSAEAYGVDISAEALTRAAANAKRNGVEVRFAQCDLLADTPALPCRQADLIVSNPPYVCDSEREAMLPNVLDFEPALALFVPDSDPLRFYRAIGQIALRLLTPDGLLVLEINERLGSETCALLQSLGFRTLLSQDFRGRDRMVTAQKAQLTAR